MRQSAQGKRLALGSGTIPGVWAWGSHLKSWLSQTQVALEDWETRQELDRETDLDVHPRNSNHPSRIHILMGFSRVEAAEKNTRIIPAPVVARHRSASTAAGHPC